MLSLPEEKGKCPVIVLGHSLLAFCEFLRYPNHLASNVTVAQSRGFESFQKAKDNLKAFQVPRAWNRLWLKDLYPRHGMG